MATLAVNHLRLATRVDSSQQALNFARSAISAATARIMENPDFGKDGDASVQLDFPDGEGFLTFNSQEALERGTSPSFNNLEGTVQILADDGTAVQVDTVRLVALGTSGTVRRTVEVVLHVPAFPWAVASEGDIHTSEGVVVGSIKEDEWPPDLDNLHPADMVANSDLEQAISLGSNSVVHGDVETPGTVQLVDSTAVVQGEVKEDADPVEIPAIETADYDPQIQGITYDSLDDYTPDGAPLELSGSARREDDLVITNGLKLTGAQLFVNGNCHIRNGLTGKGILVVTGDLLIEGGTDLDTPTRLGILAQGRIEMRGAGAASSRLRGLIYAGNGLFAEDFTLVGALLSGRTTAGTSLRRTAVVSEPVKTPGLEKMYYVGTVTDNNPTPSPWTMLPEVTETRPPLGCGFRMHIETTPGQGYPVKIELLSGDALPYTGTSNRDDNVYVHPDEGAYNLRFTLSGPEDITMVQEAYLDYFGGSAIGWLDTFWTDNPVNEFVEPLVEESESQVDIIGDLSRLIPIKDRIRFLSWKE